MASVLQTPVGPNMRNMYYQLDVNTESWARYSRGELTSDEFFLPGKDRIDVPHNNYEENEELPILDLAASADTKDGKEALITKMVEAAEKWGFFGVVNHGVSLELRRRLEAHAQEFFNLPMEQKLKGGRDQELKYGYAAGSPKFLPKKNWHEMLQLSWNPVQLEPFFHRVQSQEYDCENMRADILEYTAAMGELGRKILALLAEGLGLNPDEIRKHFRAESNSVLRVNHYPPCPHPDKIEGIHPHSDPNLITILHQDNVGGLQILKDGKWIAIQPNPETLIVNIGDILMRFIRFGQ